MTDAIGIAFRLCLLIISFLNLDINAQWYIIDSKTTEDLNDVYFIDSLNGFIVGNNSTILNTSNGGAVWAEIYCPIENVVLKHITFINDTTGITIGERGVVLRTTDRGLNWTTVFVDTSYFFHNLHFVDEKSGWICSGIYGSDIGGILFNSTDGGISWSMQYETLTDTTLLPYRLNDIFFSSEGNGIALANISIDPFGPTDILKTDTGGDSWALYSQTSSFLVTKFSKYSADTIWACGFGFEVSTNGGNNWNDQYNEVINPDSTITYLPGIIYDIQQFSGKSGYLVTFDITELRSRVFYTTNVFYNWIEDDIPFGVIPQAITKSDNTHLWMVGSNGLVMTKQNIPTSIDDIAHYPERKIVDVHFYPNPFNSSAKLKYFLAQDSFVKIVVFDSIGKKIVSLLDNKQSTGEHELIFNAQDYTLSTGVYYLLLQVGGEHNINKVIYIK